MSKVEINKFCVLGFVILTLSLISVGCLAVGNGHYKHKKSIDIGEPGKKSEVSRIIKITMFDNVFQPTFLSLKEGETIHFIIKNSGEFVHEFNIATKEMHKAHIPEMEAMIEYGAIVGDKINWEAAKSMQEKTGHDMHNELNSVLLEPGAQAEIFWKFPEHTTLEFACNIPGHYNDGMVGKIKLAH